MKLNKIISMITLICVILIPKIAHSEETADYEHIDSGTCVNQDGFFFTENGMIRLITNIDEKIKLGMLDKQKENELLKLDLQTCKNGKQIELKIQKEMFERQLKIKQDSIDAYRDKQFWGKVKLVGYVSFTFATGFLLGKYILK